MATHNRDKDNRVEELKDRKVQRNYTSGVTSAKIQYCL